jgi:hypothetical protein
MGCLDNHHIHEVIISVIDDAQVEKVVLAIKELLVKMQVLLLLALLLLPVILHS